MALAKELKEGTKQSHSAAENTKFVSSFLRGVVNREKYRQLVANYYFIYQTMETEVLRLKDDPVVPEPGKFLSIRVVITPSLDNSYAIVVPIIPAPTTTIL